MHTANTIDSATLKALASTDIHLVNQIKREAYSLGFYNYARQLQSHEDKLKEINN